MRTSDSFLLPTHRSTRRLMLVLAVLMVVLLSTSIAHARTFGVNTVNDTVDAAPGDGTCADAAGDCSLRAAVMEANAYPGADVITLPDLTGPTVYTLTIANSAGDEDAAAEGDLDISDDVTISGFGATRNDVAIDGGSLDRLFEVTVAGTNLSIDTLVMQNGGGVDEGGAIYNDQGIVNLTDVVVSANDANEMGGGIYNTGGTLDIDDSLFMGNEVTVCSTTDGGGAIFNLGIGGHTGWVISQNTEFDNNTVAGACDGGAILSIAATGTDSAIVETTGSDFTGNQADDGGAIYANASLLRVNAGGGSTFTGNTAGNYGGAIFAEGDSTVYITGAVFSSNDAATAGGGIANAGSRVQLEDITISDSEALNGGAIASQDGDLKILGTSVIGASAVGGANTATNAGGGIAFTGAGTLTIQGDGESSPVVIGGNDATGSGGGLYTDADNPVIVKYAVIGDPDPGDALDQSNTAASGGGIYNNDSIVSLYYSQITANTADNGGGIYNRANVGDAVVDLYYTTIGGTDLSEGNVATVSGGGIYNDGATASVSMDHSGVKYNQADDGAGNGDGGGAYNDGGIIGGAFAYNEAANNGGGIYNNTGEAYGWIKGNSADVDGGGVYAVGGTVGFSALLGNTAGDNGGGAYVDGAAIYEFSGTIRNNEATNESGGALYLNDTSFDIVNATITGNTADNDGGAFAVNEGVDLTLTHVTMYNNEANDTGGAVFLDDGGGAASTVDFSRSIVLENPDTDGAGNFDCEIVSGTVDADEYNLFTEDPSACNPTPAGGTTDNFGTPIADVLLTADMEESVDEEETVQYTFRLVDPNVSGNPNPAMDGVLDTTGLSPIPTVDQRDGHRPIDGDRGEGYGPGYTPELLSDIGAYEFGAIVIGESGPWWMSEGDTDFSAYSYTIEAPDVDPVGDINIDVTTNEQCLVSLTPSNDINDFSDTVTATIPAGSRSVRVYYAPVDDDWIEDNPHPCTVTHGDSVAPGDLYYDSLPVYGLTFKVFDNDIAEVLIDPVTVNLVEGDTVGAQYLVTLTASPAENETVTITPDFNTTQLAFDPAFIELDETNWDTGLTFTVTALDDGVEEGDLHASIIMHTVTAVDTDGIDGPDYDGVSAPIVTASITDASAYVPGGGGNGGNGGDDEEEGDGETGETAEGWLILDGSASTEAIVVGDTIIWIFTVTNPGPGETTPVEFTASFPDGVDILSIGTTQGTTSIEGSLARVNIGVMPAGMTNRIAITTTITDYPFTDIISMRSGNLRARPAAGSGGKVCKSDQQQEAGTQLCVTGSASGYGPTQSVTVCTMLYPDTLPETGGGAPPQDHTAWLWIAGTLAALGAVGLAIIENRRRQRQMI
ncbi:MAG: hypothetical protein JXJ17_19595 [Anaerolineae bacterium]|nr:hypothetical protein [Anaerolineae bacterium]